MHVPRALPYDCPSTALVLHLHARRKFLRSPCGISSVQTSTGLDLLTTATTEMIACAAEGVVLGLGLGCGTRL